MRILMIGDIVGQPGRMAASVLLENIVKNRSVDFVIANGENAAGGNGITHPIARDLFDLGIHVLTMGNHVWDKKEIFDFIDQDERIIRPINYPGNPPGRGYGIFNLPEGKKIAIVNASGRVFMGDLDCPFRRIDDVLPELRKETPIILVDFHAEATSEKVAMGWHLDGRVSAVIGTHTHVQTADERILPHGTAYITDVGMTGPVNSVIGVEKEAVLERFLTQMPARFTVAKGLMIFSALIVDIDPLTGMAEYVERVLEYLPD
jgi:2',3'-cyclic-nucleotide 2'-phosphodiesterase